MNKKITYQDIKYPNLKCDEVLNLLALLQEFETNETVAKKKRNFLNEDYENDNNYNTLVISSERLKVLFGVSDIKTVHKRLQKLAENRYIYFARNEASWKHIITCNYKEIRKYFKLIDEISYMYNIRKSKKEAKRAGISAAVESFSSLLNGQNLLEYLTAEASKINSKTLLKEEFPIIQQFFGSLFNNIKNPAVAYNCGIKSVFILQLNDNKLLKNEEKVDKDYLTTEGFFEDICFSWTQLKDNSIVSSCSWRAYNIIIKNIINNINIIIQLETEGNKASTSSNFSYGVLTMAPQEPNHISTFNPPPQQLQEKTAEIVSEKEERFLNANAIKAINVTEILDSQMIERQREMKMEMPAYFKYFEVRRDKKLNVTEFISSFEDEKLQQAMFEYYFDNRYSQQRIDYLRNNISLVALSAFLSPDNFIAWLKKNRADLNIGSFLNDKYKNQIPNFDIQEFYACRDFSIRRVADREGHLTAVVTFNHSKVSLQISPECSDILDELEPYDYIEGVSGYSFVEMIYIISRWMRTRREVIAKNILRRYFEFYHRYLRKHI